MKRSLAIAAAAAMFLSTLVPVGAALASQTHAVPPPPVTVLGVCIDLGTGDWRQLERRKLSRSQHGACLDDETKVLVPTQLGRAVEKLVERFPGQTKTCTLATRTAKTATYDCVWSTPSPSPSPSPAS
ncbi:hypothetical protein [Herbidospora mongoliensis]|uniref:hypothetical protein n=1 Tax=Herbidospora mongoliensis TaxID=688067 RepID=UPI000831FD20|nr:hypothetical protein [Herbidospora mongoliensis]